MDVLRRDDIEIARRTPPEERARQTLEMMRAGYRLKRSALRAQHPTESEEEIEARFRLWLEGDGEPEERGFHRRPDLAETL
jgi:hypothetical protein